MGEAEGTKGQRGGRWKERREGGGERCRYGGEAKSKNRIVIDPVLTRSREKKKLNQISQRVHTRAVRSINFKLKSDLLVRTMSEDNHPQMITIA